MNIQLDSSIRDFVFVPLILLVFALTFFRLQILKFLQGTQNSDVNITESYQIEEKIHQMRIQRLTSLIKNRNILGANSFERRKEFYLSNKDYLKQPEKPQKDPQQIPENPLAGTNMLSSLGSGIAKMAFFPLQLQLIKMLFSGFIVGKINIKLGQKFKEFLQSGLNLPNLPSEYLSAVSLYFICYLGIGKILERIFGSSEENSSQTITPQAPAANPLASLMGAHQQQQQSQQEPKEIDELRKAQYIFALEDIEQKLLDSFENETKI